MILYYTTFVAIRKGGGLDRKLPAARAGKKEAADKWGSQPLGQLRN